MDNLFKQLKQRLDLKYDALPNESWVQVSGEWFISNFGRVITTQVDARTNFSTTEPYFGSVENKHRRIPKGYVHRFVAENFCINNSGVAFKDCDVHHIDFDEENNHYSNLVILTKSEHMRLHKLGSLNPNKSGELNSFYGKTHSQETRDLISKTHKGKTISEGNKKALSARNTGSGNPMHGKRAYTDGINNKFFPENQQPEGWVLGTTKGGWKK